MIPKTEHLPALTCGAFLRKYTVDKIVTKPLIQSVKYPYRTKFTPKRGRNPRSRIFVAEGPVRFERATSAEARLAFQINLLIDHHRPPHRDSYDVLDVDGRFYWPVVDYMGRRLRNGEFLAGLQAGQRTSLEHLLSSISYSTTRGEPHELEGARDISTNEDTVLAELQRGAAEILLIGDFVYREGGEPLYARTVLYPLADVNPYDPPFNANASELISRLTLIDDRPIGFGEIYVVDPMLRHSAQSVGYIDPKDLDESLLFGAIFRADELDRAFALDGEGKAEPTEIPKIDIIGATTIRADPIHLQVKQLVRMLSRLMHQKEIAAEIENAVASKFHDLAAKPLIPNKSNEEKERLDCVAVIKTLWCSPEKSSPDSWSDYLSCLVDKAIVEINNHCRRRNTAPLFIIDLGEEELDSLESIR